jgi:sulfur relay (sulfurtransferase) DsrF/TusC family protein
MNPGNKRIIIITLGIFIILFYGETSHPNPQGPDVNFVYPPDNSYFPYPTGGIATVAGKVYYQQAKGTHYEVALVLDTSGSTIWPCGIDLDNDGITGELYDIGFSRMSFFSKKPIKLINTDPDDSILAAEVIAAKGLLRILNPATTQISLITFNGDLAADGRSAVLDTPDAFLEHPLSNDYSKVDQILTELYNRFPYGGTNMGEGIEVAIASLDSNRPGTQKIIIFLTDGVPSFPYGSANVTDPGDKEYALEAAHKAKAKGIRIDTFAIGGEALSDPSTVQEIATSTGGVYTAVNNPAEIITKLAETKFFRLKSVKVKNLTLNQPAHYILLSPDGTFMANVPVTSGPNIIQALAEATDGSQGKVDLHLYYVLTEHQPELGLDIRKNSLSDLQLDLTKQKYQILEVDVARWLEAKSKRAEIKELYLRAGTTREGHRELLIKTRQEKLNLILMPRK